jgi:hypothetical protein
MEIVKDGSKGLSEDKLRLVMTYYLSLETDMPKEEFDDFRNALKFSGADVAALDYIRRYG